MQLGDESWTADKASGAWIKRCVRLDVLFGILKTAVCLSTHMAPYILDSQSPDMIPFVM